MLHLFALFLLAQFREKRAYAPIVKMFSAPGETPFDLAGDTATEGLSRIVASVYDGNPLPLHGLIESEEVNEYVRGAAMNAFLVLEHTGQMYRDEAVGYFRSLFHGKLQRQHSYAWDGLVCAVADLPAPELLEEVRQAYADNLVDPTVADLEGIEDDWGAQKPWRGSLLLGGAASTDPPAFGRQELIIISTRCPSALMIFDREGYSSNIEAT